jgi:O-antigen/teichoic acid export membrane protein
MKQIISRTALFFLGNLFLRFLGFILLPVYVRYLSPAEYGIWGVSGSVGLFLNLMMPFGMLMAVGRFYFDAQNESERAAYLGTIFIFLVVFPLAILLLFEKLGASLFVWVTPGVPYIPYMRLTTWVTYFSMFSIIPLIVLRSREQAVKYLLLNLGQAILFHALAIGFVVFGKWGVLGMLWGNLLSAIGFAIIYVYLTLRWYPPRFSFSRFLEIFRYSLPLVFHGMAGWVLMFSDRLILEHWVSLALVGIYSLAYTIGMIVQNAADAATNAWFPAFYNSRNSGESTGQATEVVTYILWGINALSLFLTIGLHHVIGWILPAAYRGAEPVVVWVALSGVFIQVYYILSYSIHYIKKTGYLAAISWSSAIVNLIINFALIPKYGYIVAAISTLIAYMVMAGLTFFISNKLYPIDYEYKRWGCLIIPTIIFCAASAVRPTLSLRQDFAYSLATLAGWQITISLLGFYSARDKQFVKTLPGIFMNFVLKKSDRLS